MDDRIPKVLIPMLRKEFPEIVQSEITPYVPVMNEYSSVDDNKDHIEKLLRWLVAEVISAGGDGDALWYSKFYSVKDIYPICEKINSEFKFPWELTLKDDTIHWSYYQEGLIITNNIEFYNSSPSWQQVLIKY
jgi:hypothetical protein